ncbi:MAG: fructosamine kinase family protein [Sulfurimonadaceae bacterium]|nr:fructosamine kinase family protein [Sulfurimonadaceae bacterium]
MDITHLIEEQFGQPPLAKHSLNAFLSHVRLHDGRQIIVKESVHAHIEADMLRFLGKHLPCAEVYYSSDSVLLMEYLDDGCRIDEEEAARSLAQMHRKRFEFFGFERDTTIGPYVQINTPFSSWRAFFSQQRVMQMATACHNEGKINTALLKRITKFAENFDEYLNEPSHPSLLHGDIWSGNVLTRENRFAALIDPAVYYGHFEMELAFIGMFNTFGDAFYRRYGEHRHIEPGFFESRAHIYCLFPYLVHVRAFGSSYIRGLESILNRFGH